MMILVTLEKDPRILHDPHHINPTNITIENASTEATVVRIEGNSQAEGN